MSNARITMDIAFSQWALENHPEWLETPDHYITKTELELAAAAFSAGRVQRSHENALLVEALEHYLKESDGITVGIPSELVHGLIEAIQNSAALQPTSVDGCRDLNGLLALPSDAEIRKAVADAALRCTAESYKDMQLALTNFVRARSAP